MPVTNWAGSVTFGAAAVHRPDSLDALRRLVAARRSIHALGSGHSFSLVADAPHDLVRLDALPPVFALDEARREVTVGAGMRYAEVAAELHRAGWALGNMASLPHISVGGSVATGTHGSGDAQRCLAAAVTGLELIGPDGTLSTLRREEDDIFPGVVVALGALGIVTRLTLAVEPAFDMAQRVHLDVPVDEVTESFDAISGSAYSVSVFTDWHHPHAMVWRKRRLSTPESGWSGGRAAAAAVHPVEGVPPSFSTEQLDVAGPWHQRLPHFRPELTPGAGEELQSELFVPRTQAPAAFAALRALGAQLAPVLQIAEVRTVRADDLWLSGAYGRDTVTLHFTWVKNWPAVRPVLSEVERHLAPFDARPHWGKLTTDAPPALLARYPHGAQFARLAAKLDPDGKFRNPFLDALLS